MARISLLIAASATFALSAPAFSYDGVLAGSYACYTRGGTEIPGRGFTINGDGGYLDEKTDGSYVQEGRNIYFRGGTLKDRQALRLPDGRIRLSPKIFCRIVEEPAPPPEDTMAPQPPTQAQPQDSGPSETKVIHIPTEPDPHLTTTGQ